MSDPTNNVEAPVSGEPKPTPANAAVTDGNHHDRQRN